MDWTLVGCIGGIGLLIYLVGYFTGKNKAMKECVKMILTYEIKFGREIANKSKKPSDLEYGKK